MSWFSELFGEEESDYEATQRKFIVEQEDGVDVLVAPNGRRLCPGSFETPSLKTLRDRLKEHENETELEVENIVAETRQLHTHPDAARAVFQVASQFNCLEFVNASKIPEDGITDYLFDKSQGPACALACAASTLWRNYFIPMGSDDGRSLGQRADLQLNLLDKVQALLGEGLIQVRNGYTFTDDVDAVASRVEAMTEEERDELRGAFRVGVQWDAEVTDPRLEYKKNAMGKWENIKSPCGSVTQVFCSALALSSSPNLRKWRSFAQVILDAAYEATLAVALCNRLRGGSRKVYLTLLGAGNFGNGPKWIEAAIKRSLGLYRNSGLHVHLVHLSDKHPWMAMYRGLETKSGRDSNAIDEDDSEDAKDKD